MSDKVISDTIRMKAKLKQGFTEVKALIKHPMITKGKDIAGNVIEPHFIEKVTCEHNGNLVMSANWGGGVSTNPYFAFQLEGGKKGDSVKLIWTDNQGNTDENITKIK